MKKVLLFTLTAIAALCMSLGIASLNANGNVRYVQADATPGATPTLSNTKYLKSTDGKYMLLATGINNFQDTYEVGYILSDGLKKYYGATDKYYRSITIGANAKTWRVSDLFAGYEAMIVWEVERELYSEVSFRAYAKVGEREGGLLYPTEPETVVNATQKDLALDRTDAVSAPSSTSKYPTLDGGQTVENWHSSSKMLVFDYKWTTDNGSGNDYVQIQLLNASSTVLSQTLHLQHSNNQLSTFLGRTIALDDDWYQFRVRLCDIPVYGDNGGETLAELKIAKSHRYDLLVDNIRVEDVKDIDTADITLDGSYSVTQGYSIPLPDYDKSIYKTLEFDLELVTYASKSNDIRLFDPANTALGAKYRFYGAKFYTSNTNFDGAYILEKDSTHYHVAFNLSEINGGAGGKVGKIADYSTTAGAEATITNVRISTDLPSFDIYSTFVNLYVNPNTVASGKILSFDLSVPSNADLRYRLGDTGSNYFGEYRFYPAWKDYDGVSHENAITAGARNGTGVTYSEIGTNLYHLEYNLGSVSGGSATAPTSIYAIKNNGTKNSTDGHNKITNIKWLNSTNYTVTVTNGSGSGKYNSGDIATVVADKKDGKRFKEWQVGGVKVSGDETYSFAVGGDTAITAVYDDICTVTVTEGFGGGEYVVGDEVTVVANEKSEKFVGWKNDSGSFVSGNRTYTFTASADVSLTATYGKVYLESGFDIPLPDYDAADTDVLALEFDVYVTSARSPYTKIYWRLYDASDNYFGYYRITYAGIQATNTSGYSVENTGADTFHVTLVLKDLAGGSGTPGKLVRLVDVAASSANLEGAWIENIEFTYAKISLSSGYELDLPDYNEENANTLAFGMDVYTGDAGKLDFGIYDESDNYFGNYRLTYAGLNVGYNHAGVEVETLGTHKYHVTFNLAALSGGSGTPGKLVSIKDISSSNLDGSWIRFTGFETAKTYNVTVENGTGGGEYVVGMRVTIERNSGSNFIGWKDGEGNWVKQNGEYVLSDSLTFVLTEDVSYSAVFGPYALSSGFEIPLPDYDENYKNVLALEFDVRAKSASPYAKVYWNLYDAEDNYFGYYRATYSGIQAANTSGYSFGELGDDTLHVTLVLKDLVKGSSGTPGKLVKLADSGLSTNLDDTCWISNISWNYSEVSENEVLSLDVPANTAQVLKTDSAPVSRETRVLLSGAKGERETAQLTMYATENIADKEFDVTFTDFVGANGTIPASAMETSMFGYIDVDSNFFTDPSSYDLPLGEFPDWMLPLSVAKSAGENVLNVSSGNNQGLFFIMNIPSTANKGTYYGNVIIDIEDNLPMCLPVEIEVFGFALPEQNQANVLMGIRNDLVQNLYTEYKDDDRSNAMYSAIRSELTARGISVSEITGTAYSSGTIGNRYIPNLKAAAADPKVTVYKLNYNTDTWSSIKVSGTAYNWNGTTTTLTNQELGATVLPRVYDVTAEGKTYYGLIGLFNKLADESTNDVDLFKKAVVFSPYDEHYGINAEIQILLGKYAVYFARDYVVANHDWTGKTGVRDSLANLRYIVASAPVPSLYYGNTIRVTDYTAPSFKEQTVGWGWLPTSSTTIKLDAFMTDVFNFQQSGITSVVTAQSVADSDAILAKELDPATEDDYLLYWYTPVGGDKNPYYFASLSTNASVLDYRVNYWQQFKRGIDGIQYWLVANSQLYVPHFTATGDSKVKSGKDYYQADATALYGYSRVYPAVGSSASGLYEYNYSSTYEDPGEFSETSEYETYILENGLHFQGCYGEGSLLYMVRDTYGEYGANLLATLRLENVAEAIDDYNYLAYAQSLIDDIADAGTKSTYQATFDGLFDDLFDLTDGSGNTTTCAFKADGGDLKTARAALATLIETLLAL